MAECLLTMSELTLLLTQTNWVALLSVVQLVVSSVPQATPIMCAQLYHCIVQDWTECVARIDHSHEGIDITWSSEGTTLILTDSLGTISFVQEEQGQWVSCRLAEQWAEFKGDIETTKSLRRKGLPA